MRIELTTEHANQLTSALIYAKHMAEITALKHEKTAALYKELPNSGDLVAQFEELAADERNRATEYKELTRIISNALYNTTE